VSTLTRICRLGLGLLAVSITACDSRMSNTISIATGKDDVGPSGSEAMSAVHEVLSDCGLRQLPGSTDTDELWEWRNPWKPPAFHVHIRRSAAQLQVFIGQDSYGSPTDKYRSVSARLRESMEKRFGGAVAME
jgi:hypothetical protein